jgi:hypothetical protein
MRGPFLACGPSSQATCLTAVFETLHTHTVRIYSVDEKMVREKRLP